MDKQKIRVLIVDDQNVVRDGMVTMLSFQKSIEIAGEAENGIQAVEIAKLCNPDVVLMDMMMPFQDGLTTIYQMKANNPDIRILVLTSFADSDLVFRAIKAGALGYLLKDATRLQLIQSIQEVAEGKAYLHPSIALKVIKEFDDTDCLTELSTVALTQREKESLKYIAQGFSNQEIAIFLNVHERTIAKYVSSILRKLQVSNRTQAALYAVKNGLAPITVS